MLKHMIRAMVISILLALAGFYTSTVKAAGPLTCTIAPAGAVAAKSIIQVKAAGGIAPYWLSVATPDLVTYTPSKLDRNGNPGGLWNISTIKSGQAVFMVRDASGATASASVTISAPAAVVPQPAAPPLVPALSNRAPFTGDTVTLTVSGGVKPYRVMADPPANVTINQTSDAAWAVKLMRAGDVTLSIQDASQRTTAITGRAQHRPMPLYASINRTRLYWQVLPDAAQQPITLKILTGNPPYNVFVDQEYLTLQQTGPNIYSITSNGRGGDTIITVRDNAMQEMKFPVHAAKPLSINWLPKDRKLKVGEGFTVLILGGEPPFKVKTWAEGAYVSEGIKDSRYAASYFVGGMKSGVHKINITDASFPETNYGYQLEVTVEP